MKVGEVATPQQARCDGADASMRAAAKKKGSKRAPSRRCNAPAEEEQPAKTSRCGPRNGLLLTREAEALAKVRSIEAVVVNLERRPDRMDGCASRIEERCPWLQYKRFPACDGKVTPMSESEVVTAWNTAPNVVYQRKRALRKGWDDLDTYEVRDLVLSPGERGCAISHIRAWELCLERSGGRETPLMVLEDDAAPTPEFTATLCRAITALPDDAHILYLGYSQAAEWRREVSPEVVEAEYVWTTVGYIIWPAGARLLLNRLPVNQPVDNWMAAQCAAGDVKAYCVRPKIVLQADAWNVNSDVAHSDEHYWGPCSDIHHSDSFYPGLRQPAGQGEQSAFWNADSDDSEDDLDP